MIFFRIDAPEGCSSSFIKHYMKTGAYAVFNLDIFYISQSWLSPIENVLTNIQE